MDALAQTTPPRSVLEEVLKFLVELMAIATSSTPSQFNKDQPSSLYPFTALLKPLHS